MATSADKPQEPGGPRIRRQPTGPIPHPSVDETGTRIIRRAPVDATIQPAGQTRPRTAIGAAATAIASGWATAAVATDLIGSRWPSDRVFCLAIGFLTALFAVTSISGVVLLLTHRGPGRYLIAFGSAVALLTFGALFVAETTLAWPVYLVPVLPLAALALALHPETRRWGRSA